MPETNPGTRRNSAFKIRAGRGCLQDEQDYVPWRFVEILPAVLAALRSEVLPPIDRPLDANVVAELAAARSSGRPAGAYAVACLFAALGRTADARRWIGEYHSAVEALGLPEQPIDVSRSAFLRQLVAWMEASTSDAELLNILEQEKVKLLSKT